MARELVIGRGGHQPFPLVDQKVSTYHAKLIINENGALQLVDTNSRNGTYIYSNGQFMRIAPNRAYQVSPDTMIQLGPETRFHVRRLLAGGGQTVTVGPGPLGPGNVGGGGVRKQPPVEKVDISHLRRISEFYNEEKIRLQTKMGNINSLRSLTLVASIAAGALGGILADQLGFGSDNRLASGALGLGVAIVLIVTLLIVINSMSKKLIREQNDNEKRYSVKYVCPKCNLPFKGKMYENILAEGSCPKCKTKYYEAPRGHGRPGAPHPNNMRY